ncbi:hypothetical protein PR048_009221 [Dryococelus australis]|uniref:Uncharacterized protein n=1 Tax=Dryococelus australis TaxID=614101 RepID=A0ABQ9I0D5_9NEOP|nr:hypothetical protein PR048_009221 [Dryococelus australis]
MNKEERRPKPGGALKRKLKKEREVNVMKTNKVLDTYFTAIPKPEKSQAPANYGQTASHLCTSDVTDLDVGEDVYPEAKDAGTAWALIAENNSRFSSSECEIEDSDPDENISTHNLTNFVSPNVKDPVTLKRAFLKQHPVQIHHVQGETLPFEPSNLYYRTLPNGEKVQIKWLSCSFQVNKVFCSTCTACGGKENGESSFISGQEVSYKHIYKTVEIHENSKFHQNSVTAVLQLCKQGDIESLLNNSQATNSKKQIVTRRQIHQRLIDITLFIGRQRLAYRGKEEAEPECKGGGMGDPRENPLTSGIIRLDPDLRKPGRNTLERRLGYSTPQAVTCRSSTIFIHVRPATLPPRDLTEGGGKGDSRENPPTNGIIRHDSHMRKSGVNRPGIEPGSLSWEASRLTGSPN